MPVRECWYASSQLTPTLINTDYCNLYMKGCYLTRWTLHQLSQALTDRKITPPQIQTSTHSDRRKKTHFDSRSLGLLVHRPEIQSKETNVNRNGSISSQVNYMPVQRQVQYRQSPLVLQASSTRIIRLSSLACPLSY
jgi:hypothetical protein